MTEDTQEQRSRMGQRIRQLRLTRGITQTWMAAQLGITPSALCLYEQGKNTIPSTRLEQIADLLHVRPGALYPKRLPAPPAHVEVSTDVS